MIKIGIEMIDRGLKIGSSRNLLQVFVEVVLSFYMFKKRLLENVIYGRSHLNVKDITIVLIVSYLVLDIITATYMYLTIGVD